VWYFNPALEEQELRHYYVITLSHIHTVVSFRGNGYFPLDKVYFIARRFGSWLYSRLKVTGLVRLYRNFHFKY
jgi:hypothetical protein